MASQWWQQVDVEKLKQPVENPAVAEQAAQPKAQFVRNSMLSLRHQLDELELRIASSRQLLGNAETAIAAFRGKLDQARQLHEASRDDESRGGKADQDRANRIMEKYEPLLADAMANLAQHRGQLKRLEEQKARFPMAELRDEERRAQLRQACR